MSKRGALKNQNITVKAELDYERLAQEIVKAQKEANNIESTSAFLKNFMMVLFYVLGATLIFLAICCIVILIKEPDKYPGYVIASMIIFVLVYGIGAIILGKDINKITDRNYIVGFFSAIVSMTALIISIVSVNQ